MVALDSLWRISPNGTMPLISVVPAILGRSHAAKAIWIHVSFNSHIEYKVD